MTIVCFIYVLDVKQHEYIEEYNKQTIKMSDFTIRVKNLPSDAEFGGKKEILKAELWAHFEQLLVKEKDSIAAHLKQFFKSRMPPTMTHSDDLEKGSDVVAPQIP